MNITKIFELWDEDSKVHESQIAENAMDQAKLHSKWLRILAESKLRLAELDEEYKVLLLKKTNYYSGKLSAEELKEEGWEPCRLKILNKDLKIHIDADSDISKCVLTKALAKEKVDVLESIIKMIMNRNFSLKTALDAIKFKNGEY